MDKEKIKELLKDAKSEEEAMKILADQKIELTDEELEELRGGSLAYAECVFSAIGTAALSITLTTD